VLISETVNKGKSTAVKCVDFIQLTSKPNGSNPTYGFGIGIGIGIDFCE